MASALAAAVVVALIVLLAGYGGVSAQPGKEKGRKKGWLDPASTNYIVLDRNRETGQERFFCLARGRCQRTILQCPAQCPERKPKKNRRVKGCFADCSSRCETTCKYRKAKCNGYGSVCYDPRFVGGDGVMFYFHGVKGADFALVSDHRLQINAHLIGTRPEGRSRDFTWVQSLALLFDAHTLVLSARPVARWDDAIDALALRWDGRDQTVDTDGEAEWRPPEEEASRVVLVERTDVANSVKVSVAGLVEMDVTVVPIGEEENRTHGYRLPAGDAFAHLEAQFRFADGALSAGVEGILGQTYRPGYVSPVKQGVAMPVIGGEDRYRLRSFLSTTCAACRFRRPAGLADDEPSSSAASDDVARSTG